RLRRTFRRSRPCDRTAAGRLPRPSGAGTAASWECGRPGCRWSCCRPARRKDLWRFASTLMGILRSRVNQHRLLELIPPSRRSARRLRIGRRARACHNGLARSRAAACRLGLSQFSCRRRAMSNNSHVYKQIELVGSSTKSSDDAIVQAIARASETLRNLDWFEVTELRGHIKDGKIEHWQVGLKIGMRLEDGD